MNKKIVSMILGLSLSSLAFGVSILIPDSYNGHWVRYTNVKSYNSERDVVEKRYEFYHKGRLKNERGNRLQNGKCNKFKK